MNRHLAGLILLTLPCLAVRPDMILGVDFGQSATAGASTTGTTPLEPGFQGFYLPNAAGTGVFSLTYGGLSPVDTATGSLTVSVQGEVSGASGNMGGRDRLNPVDAGAFTYGDLLRDGLARTKLTSVAGEYTLRIEGLLANTPYQIRIWGPSSANDLNTTYTWHTTSGASTEVLGSFLNGPSNPLTASANTDYSAVGTVMSSLAGELRFGVTSSNGSPSSGYIAGFELNAVPEPGTSALLLLGGVMLLRRRPRA